MAKLVKTRFAPSPTGMLHIGGAKIALFNYLFAKHHNGKFLLRIEDTDKERSTNEGKQEIIKSLKWLGLNYDDDIVYQSKRQTRHKEIANLLLKSGKAYKCFASKEELNAMREDAEKNKIPLKYNKKWRDVKESEYPKNTEICCKNKSSS